MIMFLHLPAHGSQVTGTTELFFSRVGTTSVVERLFLIQGGYFLMNQRVIFLLKLMSIEKFFFAFI
jgi:hypothetical protein